MQTTPPSPLRWIVPIVLGVALFALGAFIGVRPLFTHNGVLTSARWLDMTFAIVFMLRGALNVKTALQRRERAMVVE